MNRRAEGRAQRRTERGAKKKRSSKEKILSRVINESSPTLSIPAAQTTLESNHKIADNVGVADNTNCRLSVSTYD